MIGTNVQTISDEDKRSQYLVTNDNHNILNISLCKIDMIEIMIDMIEIMIRNNR